MPILSLKSICSSFSQSSHISFGLSLMPSALKLFCLDRSSRSIKWSYISYTRLCVCPKFSSTRATLPSKRFSVCSMLCLISLISFFSSTICCFFCSSSALVIIFSISVVSFSSVHSVVLPSIFSNSNRQENFHCIEMDPQTKKEIIAEISSPATKTIEQAVRDSLKRAFLIKQLTQ